MVVECGFVIKADRFLRMIYLATGQLGCPGYRVRVHEREEGQEQT